MNAEHRRFRRIEFDAKVELELADQRIPGIVRDISLKGALIVLADTDPDIRPGQTGHLMIRLDQGDVEMNMDVEVAYFHPGRHACGLNIHLMDVDTASHLKRLIELNLGDEVMMQRELNKLIEAMEAEHH